MLSQLRSIVTQSPSCSAAIRAPEIRFELAVADDRRADPFGPAIAQDRQRVDQIGDAAAFDERTHRQHRARITERVGPVPERAEIHAAIDAVDVLVRARAGDGEQLLTADLARHDDEFRFGDPVPDGPGIPRVVVDLAPGDREAVPDAGQPLDFAEHVGGREMGGVQVVDAARGGLARDPGRLRADGAGRRAIRTGFAEIRARRDPRDRRRHAGDPGILDRVPARLQHEDVNPDAVPAELEDLVADEALGRRRHVIEHVANRPDRPPRHRALRRGLGPQREIRESRRGASPLDHGRGASAATLDAWISVSNAHRSVARDPWLAAGPKCPAYRAARPSGSAPRARKIAANSSRQTPSSSVCRVRSDLGWEFRVYPENGHSKIKSCGVRQKIWGPPKKIASSSRNRVSVRARVNGRAGLDSRMH